MNAPDPDRLARLPKWARDHINRAGAYIEHLESDRDELAGSPVGRVVVAGHRLTGGLRPVLPNDYEPITWRLQSHIDDHVAVRYSPASQSHDSLPGVTIQGGRALIVRPLSSNLIYVRPETAEEWTAQRERHRQLSGYI
jgi:hypothetical protein